MSSPKMRLHDLFREALPLARVPQMYGRREWLLCYAMLPWTART